MRKNATKLAALALTLAMTVTSVALPSSASAATKTVKLNTTSKTLYATGSSAKKTTTLKVTVNGKKKTATFKSSNTKVATVGKTSGKVTAKKAGKATITATYGGKKVTCKITVKAKFVKVTSVSVSPKTVSLAVGKTKTIKTTVKPSKASIKKVTYASSNKSVATVTSAGKITAKKAGTAKVTVTATDGTKKKATVTVKVTKATTPTATPSATPDATPVPTETPAATATSASATAITSFKQTGAAKLTAEFAGPVSDAAKVEVTKDGKTVEAKKVTFNDTKTAVVFEAKANFVAGECTITVTDGDKKLTEKTKVETEKIVDIAIKGDTALTGKGNESDGDNTEAYIYYEVLNQFKEKAEGSSDINWTISSSTGYKEDKTTGKLTIWNEKSDTQERQSYTYGTEIYLVGVDVKSGLVVNKSVKVGMAQAIDTVVFEGFIDTKGDKTKFIQALPENFQKDRYVLCYSVYDQNKNEMTAREYTTSELTVLASDPLVISSTFKAGKIYSVEGKEYASVVVNPASYAGNGGDIEFTMISNKTGKKSSKKFKVGAEAKLKSLKILAPTYTIADGDTDKELKYEAVDTNGNAVTSYETIVRSTNALTLSTSVGTLKIAEDNDGKAVIKWSDGKTGDGKDRKYAFDENSASDGQPRVVAISTIVAGGESNNMTFNVSDARRPFAFKHITFGADDNNAVVSGSAPTVKFYDVTSDPDNSSTDYGVTYLDQYGDELDKKIANAFFSQAKDGFNNKKYAIKVTSTSADKEALGSNVFDTTYYGVNDTDAAGDSTAVTGTEVSYNTASSIDDRFTALYAAILAYETANSGFGTDAASDAKAKAAAAPVLAVAQNLLKTAEENIKCDKDDYKAAKTAFKSAIDDLVKALAKANTNNGALVTDITTAVEKFDADGNAGADSTAADAFKAEVAKVGTIYTSSTLDDKRASVTVKYAIVAKKADAANDKFTEVSKVDKEEYTVVTPSEIKDRMDIVFNTDKVRVSSNASAEPNLSALGGTKFAFETTTTDEGDDKNFYTGKHIQEFNVKGTTSDSITVTIPKEQYKTAKDSNTKVVSQLDFTEETNKITGVNPTDIREDLKLSEKDFYDVNSAKGTRKDATVKLVTDVYGVQVAKTVKASDAKSAPAAVKFTYKKKVATKGVAGLNKTEVATIPYTTKEDATDALSYVVLDQYNCYMPSATAVSKTIGEIKESQDARFNHLPASFAPVKNGTMDAYVKGAEIADKYKLTVSVDGYNGVSSSVGVTVGSDSMAKITNESAATTEAELATKTNTDKAFREIFLNMKRD